MRKLHGNKEKTLAVLLALCVLLALSDNGFTCHNIVVSTAKHFSVDYTVPCLTMLILYYKILYKIPSELEEDVTALSKTGTILLIHSLAKYLNSFRCNLLGFAVYASLYSYNRLNYSVDL
jgi:hypothetical protein